MSGVHWLDVSAKYHRRDMADSTHLTRVRLAHADIPNDESTPTIVLPAGPRLPRGVQGLLALTNRSIGLQILRGRYGSAF